MMARLVLVLIGAAMVAGVAAQEREVPKDSVRITVPGCARGRLFTVGPREENEPIRSDVPPGRRFRLAGKKDVLREVEEHESSQVRLTGLIRKSDVYPPGAKIGGVIVGPGPSPTDPRAARSSGYNEAVFDVESWEPMPGSCPRK
jgi:hypothetical protein